MGLKTRKIGTNKIGTNRIGTKLNRIDSKLNKKTRKKVCYSSRELVHICGSEKYIDVEDNLFTKKYEIELSKKPYYLRDIEEYKKHLIKEFTNF